MSRRIAFPALVSAMVVAGCGAVAAPSTTGISSAAASSAAPDVDFTKLPEAVTAAPILWLAADVGVTTESEGLVTDWKGIGGTARPSAPNERPTLVPDGIGGRPALQFDGKDDQLEVAEVDINPSVHPDLTVVAVFTSDVAEVADPFRKLYGHDDAGYDRSAGLDQRGMRNYSLFGGETGGVVGYFDLEADATYVTVDAWHPKTVEGWVNGKSRLGKGWPVDNSEGLPTFFIGGTGTVFREPWQGKIAEMLVFDGALPEPARVAIEEFLAMKYGIELER